MHLRGALRRVFVLLAVLAAVATAAAKSSSAQAATVAVLAPDGRLSLRQDRFVPVEPNPVRSRLSQARTFAPRSTRTVTAALARLRRAHAIGFAFYRRYRSIYASALGAEAGFHGTAATQLGAVLANVRYIAASGELTPGRLPALFETLRRNVQWWRQGTNPASGQLIEFTGSQLVWEYYPGQGVELQVLATFGKADGLYTAGPSYYAQMRSLLAEMIPLATRRGRGLTWEYYFWFEGGAPPWTSAMSQATGIEALTRAYEAFGQRYYLGLAHQALPIFTIAPPLGVAVNASRGTRYVQYSFGPGEAILNAFLQSLIGLYDYASASGDQLARGLFAAGDAEARWEVPHYDTGTWSLYEPGVPDSVSYHELVTGFLQELCSRTNAPVYCVTAQHFESYLYRLPRR